MANDIGVLVIGKDNRWIFLHWPKTGGNSVQLALSDFSNDTLISRVSSDEPLNRFELTNPLDGRLTKHSGLNDYRRALGLQVLRSAHIFVTIRNPWDRIVSHFFSPHRGEVIWDEEKFRRFVLRAPSLRNFLSLRLAQGVVGVPGLWLVDSILRFEQLEADFAQCVQALDLPGNPPFLTGISVHTGFTTRIATTLRCDDSSPRGTGWKSGLGPTPSADSLDDSPPRLPVFPDLSPARRRSRAGGA